MNNLSQWLRYAFWPCLLVVTVWAWSVELSFIFHLVVVVLIITSILLAWWQNRWLMGSISLVFIAMTGFFAYLQLTGFDIISTLLVFFLVVMISTLAIFVAFDTYSIEVKEPKMTVYWVGMMFMILQLFWLLTQLIADPVIRAALVAGLFYVMFALITLHAWDKLEQRNFRMYLLSLTVFFIVFAKLL